MATARNFVGDGQEGWFDNVAASATDSVLVAGQTGYKIRLLRTVINHGDTTASAVTFNSKGGGAGTPISPLLKGAANNGFIVPDTERGWWETKSGEALTVTTAAGSTTGVSVVVKRVPA